MSKNKDLPWFLLLLGLYLVVSLFRLTALPVFADEAIYIRWAQLIIDDASRYFFYPMNDGKTPLLMWLMVPALHFFTNQLWAGRLISVLAGGLSLLAIFLIMRQLKFKRTSYLAMLLFILSPFTFFHNRLAITDALLLANLAMAYYFTLRLVGSKKLWPIFGVAIFFFMSIMSKTPALLFMPVFYLTIFLPEKFNWRTAFVNFAKISSALLFAGLGFYSFRVVPLFSQLFAVGGNFLQSKEVIFSTEIFSVALRNGQFFSTQLLTYLGPALLILALPCFAKTRRTQTVLFLSGILFLLPLILFGRILYSRYALPSGLFLIASAAISLVQLGQKHKIWQWLALALILVPNLFFIQNAYFNVNALKLSASDRSQYLEEWSSGHGIAQATTLIEELAKTQRVAVATEGFFGTLPDGILLNLHNKNVNNIYVEGIGQPILSIPPAFWQKAKDFDIKLLIINSHRLKMDLPAEALLANFCRPNGAPCLQVWQIAEP